MEEGPVRRRTVADSSPNSRLPTNPLDKRWFVHIDEKTYGPYSGNDIKRLAADNRIMGSDWLCPEGGSAWVEAKNEPTLGSLFRAPASAPQPPRAATRAAAQTRNQMQDLLTAVRADNGRATDAKPWWKRFKSDAIEREDQESIREDLREFFGPRADKFLPVYDKMQAAKKTYVISWTWPAFLRPIRGISTAKCTSSERP